MRLPEAASAVDSVSRIAFSNCQLPRQLAYRLAADALGRPLRSSVIGLPFVQDGFGGLDRSGGDRVVLGEVLVRLDLNLRLQF